MRGHFSAIFCGLSLGLMAVLVGSAMGQEQGLELVWRSGEKLTGRVTGAGAGTLSFQPQLAGLPGLFPEPAELRLERLEELRVMGEEAAPRTETFWLRLRDGGRLLVDVVALEDGWLKVKSGLLGAVAEIRLADVAFLERARGDGVLFFGEGPGLKWSESPRVEEATAEGQADPFAAPPAAPAALRVRRVNRSRNVNGSEPGQVLRLWQRLPEGGLRTVSWSSSLSAPLPAEVAAALPEKMKLDLRLRAETAPRFSFKLLTKGAELRVETWEDRLVLREGSRYQAAAQVLKADTQELRLSVLWDSSTHEVRLLSGAGEVIAQLPAAPAGGAGKKKVQGQEASRGSVPVEIPGGVGVALENLGTDLTLEAVSLMRWDGSPPQAEPVGSPFARRQDGRVVAGRWVALQAGELVFEGGGEGGAVRVPLAEIHRIEPGPAKAPPPAPVGAAVMAEIFSRDEEWLRGEFTGMQASPDAAGGSWQVRLKQVCFREPCGVLLNPLRSLVWPGETAGQAEGANGAGFTERLQVGTEWVRGRAVAAGEVLPRWLFDGAVSAVPLNPAQVSVIERDPKAMPPALEHLQEGMAFLALKRGDLLPARVDGMSREGLAFAAPGVLPITMARAEALGVLIPGKPILTEGFRDAGWRQLRGEASLFEGEVREEIRLNPGQALGHPAMMAGDGLDFVLKEAEADAGMNGVASLRLTLFARQLETNEANLRLLVAFVGEEIYCGDETGDGQMRHQGQAVRAGAEVNVQVRALADRLLVRVNGHEVVNIPIPAEARQGSGLILEPAELWGNPAQAIRVAGFAARKSAHQGRVPQVNEESRRQVLTLPRSRNEEWPEQILIAPTGDLLRGTVQSWTEQDMELRWGLDTWRVPRERLAAVVLLDPPVDAVAAPKAADSAAAKAVPAVPTKVAAHWLLLANGGRLGLQLTRWAEDGVVGLHPLLGRVVVPVAAVRSVWANTVPAEAEAQRAMTGWQMTRAAPPQIPETAGAESPQVGTEGKNFTLPLLEGGDFVLEKQRGKVVVLDFWASWCAPCLKALPETMEALKGLPSDQVLLIGVNQGEPAPQVRTFLTTRRWNLATVLDVDQAVGKQFGVESIPHTVVIGPDGKVALVKTGYSETAAGEIAAKVRELLKAE